MNCPTCNAPIAEGQTQCSCCGMALTQQAQAAAQYMGSANNYCQNDNNNTSAAAPFDMCNGNNPYIPAQPQESNADSTLALVLGIVSLVGTLLSCVCGCLGSLPALICSIIGLVIAIRCRKMAAAAGYSDGKATAGMVTSIIGLCLCGLSCVSSLGIAVWTFFTEL